MKDRQHGQYLTYNDVIITALSKGEFHSTGTDFKRFNIQFLIPWWKKYIAYAGI